MTKGKSKKALDTPQIKISGIRRDGGTQAREGIKQNTVNEYTEAIRNGDNFPPVVVFNDGETLWLADGFHRVAAALNAGLEEIFVEMKEGTIHDAKWYALGANKDHGERMSNADKRCAVTMVLQDEELSKLSDREIATQCKVTQPFVSKIRKDLSDNGYHFNVQENQTKPERDPKNLEEIIAERVQEETERRIAEEREQHEKEIQKIRAEMEESQNASHPEGEQNEEVERLRQELAGKEQSEQEKDEEARQLREELDAFKNTPAPDVEAIVAERMKAAQEDTEHRAVEERERHAEEVQKLHAEMEELRNAQRPEDEQNEEMERLRQELAYKEQSEQEKDEEARKLREELNAIKNTPAPDVEAIVAKRMKSTQKEADRRFNEERERHAEEVRKLLDQVNELRNAEAVTLGKEDSISSSELERDLLSEITNLKNAPESETYREGAKTRFKKAVSEIDKTLHIIGLLNERVLRDPELSSLMSDEISLFREGMSRMMDNATITFELSNQLLEHAV